MLLGRGHEAADPGLHAVEHLLQAAGHVPGTTGHTVLVPGVVVHGAVYHELKYIQL